MRTTQNVCGLRMGGARLIATGIVWLCIGILCSPAWGQKGHAPKPQEEMQQVSIDVRRTSLLAVIDQLMKQVHANYTLDSQLQDAPIGAIHLTKVPFRTALEVVLKASGKPATYQFQADVYMVVAQASQQDQAAGPVQSGFMPREVQVASTPEPDITIMPGDSPEQPRVKLSVQNGDLFTTLQMMFTRANIQYTLTPALHNISITASIDKPLRTTLETLLRASGKNLTYRVENDIYDIIPKHTDDPVP